MSLQGAQETRTRIGALAEVDGLRVETQISDVEVIGDDSCDDLVIHRYVRNSRRPDYPKGIKAVGAIHIITAVAEAILRVQLVNVFGDPAGGLCRVEDSSTGLRAVGDIAGTAALRCNDPCRCYLGRCEDMYLLSRVANIDQEGRPCAITSQAVESTASVSFCSASAKLE